MSQQSAITPVLMAAGMAGAMAAAAATASAAGKHKAHTPAPTMMCTVQPLILRYTFNSIVTAWPRLRREVIPVASGLIGACEHGATRLPLRRRARHRY
jgi:hypothetical protein